MISAQLTVQKSVTNIYLRNDAMSILSLSQGVKNTKWGCACEGKIMHSKMMSNKISWKDRDCGSVEWRWDMEDEKRQMKIAREKRERNK